MRDVQARVLSRAPILFVPSQTLLPTNPIGPWGRLCPHLAQAMGEVIREIQARTVILTPTAARKMRWELDMAAARAALELDVDRIIGETLHAAPPAALPAVVLAYMERRHFAPWVVLAPQEPHVSCPLEGHIPPDHLLGFRRFVDTWDTTLPDLVRKRFHMEHSC